MPHLRFELTNRRFILDMSTDFSQRKLVFDAEVEPLDDFGVPGKATLRKGVVHFINAMRESDAPIGSIHYIEAWEDSDTGDNYPAAFEIATWLPTESFEPLLNANLKEVQILLTFRTRLNAPGIAYGYDPDGREKWWDVEKENPVSAESITLAIVPREEAEPEMDEYRPVETPPPAPVAVRDPQLTNQLRSLWWAIVVIGGLALMKLYR